MIWTLGPPNDISPYLYGMQNERFMTHQPLRFCVMFWPLPALMDSECRGFLPKEEILNPVTQRRNSSTGSPAAAKRGYDTESVAWSQSRAPPPLSVGERGSGCLTVGESKAQNNCENQQRVTLVCHILSGISVFDIET